MIAFLASASEGRHAWSFASTLQAESERTADRGGGPDAGVSDDMSDHSDLPCPCR